MKSMIAYCGLDCEKCDAYLATINDDQVLREKTAKLWAELNNAPILPEHINCEGCRIDGMKTVFCDSLCAIRQCALRKGLSVRMIFLSVATAMRYTLKKMTLIPLQKS